MFHYCTRCEEDVGTRAEDEHGERYVGYVNCPDFYYRNMSIESSISFFNPIKASK